MGALTTAAHAETFTIEVPFAFEAGGKNFPAGAYTVDPVASGGSFAGTSRRSSR